MCALCSAHDRYAAGSVLISRSGVSSTASPYPIAYGVQQIDMSEVMIQKWNTASSLPLAATCTDHLTYIIGNSSVQPAASDSACCRLPPVGWLHLEDFRPSLVIAASAATLAFSMADSPIPGYVFQIPV